MHVLVTGGAGFIGANLCRALGAAGHQATAFDDLSTGSSDNLDGTAVELLVGSILDVDAINAAAEHVDAVVHLAALPSVPRSVSEPVASHLANATGTVNVLEAARRDGGRHVVTAGSSSVYGANPVLPKHVDLATRPISPYAASKLAAEAYTLAYGHSYDLPTLSFRFFNVYGPLQPAGHAYAAAIPAFIDAALRDQPIPVFGDGRQSRDFTFVDTVTGVIVDALERRLTNDDPMNLAFGTRTSLLSVIESIGQILDTELPIDFKPTRPGDVPHSQADSTPVSHLFPNVSPTSLDDGLRATVEWMQQAR